MVKRPFLAPVCHRAMALALSGLLLVAWGQPAEAAPGSATGQISPQAKEAQRKVDAASQDYQLALQRVAAIGAQSARLSADATAAATLANQLHDQVSGDSGGLLQALGDLVGSESDLDRAAEAADEATRTRQLADMASTALSTAIVDSESARLRWEDARRREQQAEAQWNAKQTAHVAIQRAQFQAGYAVADHAQDRRNHAALRTWRDYLQRLATAAVVPPAATALADPARLAAPLELVRDRHGDVVPGVAQVDPPGARSVTVLPAETIRAVSEAFRRVGLPDVPGAIDPATYACGGFLANAWGPTTITLPADAEGQWSELRQVPRGSLQVGDIVVLGSKRAGLDQTGVYVGEGRLIVAEPQTGTAGVQELPARHVLGVRRVTLPVLRPAVAAPSGGTCGIAPVATATGPGSGPLQLPLGTSSYRLSAGFGQGGGLWSSGEHTGQDFADPIGTPVLAAAAGVVSIEHPGWAGNLVRIDHGGGVETWYAHLSRVDVSPGQSVQPGELIGAVGDLGNTTGPHLHFEVRLDGSPVDPLGVLDLPEAPRPAYVNGQLPDSALCPATPDGFQRLRCDAAVSFRLLSAGFEAAQGAPLCITDSYRSRAGQQNVFQRKPALAATPGTSIHGWGRAVDLCGGVERFGTAENDWLLAHGPAYGWVHPSWAGAGGSRPEPWHFEYAG